MAQRHDLQVGSRMSNTVSMTERIESSQELRWYRGREPKSEPPRDGRAARALRTREAVADALSSLICEGHLRPTSKAIAERARVSERTIFQHFEDLETLFNVAAVRHGERIIGQLDYLLDHGEFEARLSAYLDELIYVHESTTPIRRASRLHEPFSPDLNRSLASWRENLRLGIDRVFSKELSGFTGEQRRDHVEALALVANWSSWENMTHSSEFSRDRARRIIEMSFRSILAGPLETT